MFLTESIGKAKAAKSLGISSQTLKKYLGFAAVPEKLREFVPKELSRDDCVKLYQAIPNVSKALRIADKIIPLDQKLRKEYLKSLTRSSKAGLFQKVTILLNKGNARKLRSLAMRKEMEVTEMADEILSSYLKRK